MEKNISRSTNGDERYSAAMDAGFGSASGRCAEAVVGWGGGGRIAVGLFT